MSKHSFCTSLVLTLFYLLFTSLAAFAVGTVAGTGITVPSAEVRSDTNIGYSNPLSFTVSQDHGMTLITPEVMGTVSPNQTYYFPFTLTNVGNGSDIYSFELSGTKDKWSSTLIKDDNANGIYDPTENTPVPSSIPLSEDATYKLFLALTAPQFAVTTETGYTTLKVLDQVNDGSGYYGANGVFYGGPDSDSSLVQAKLINPDVTPPTISKLMLNDRKRFPNDIVSSHLKVSANIIDDIPRNVDKIEIWINDSLKYQGTAADWKGAYYNIDTGDFELDLTPPLDPGTYTFKIIAGDKSGNLVNEVIAPLYVFSADDQRMIGPPVNFPNPFSPLSGQKTSIAYTLTTDCNITIYIFDIRGATVWKRSYLAFEEGGKAGYNEIIWNGISDFREVLGNGIYIAKITVGQKVFGTVKPAILDHQ